MRVVWLVGIVALLLSTVPASLASTPPHPSVAVSVPDPRGGSETGAALASPASPRLSVGWTDLTLTLSKLPPARALGAMTYDASDGVVLLFGGCSETVPISLGGCTSVLGDTWEFSGGAWTQLNPSTSPSARWGAMMTYDPSIGEVLLFGGDGASTTPDSDLWEFHAGTWTEITASATPGDWWIGGFTYDPNLGEDMLAGGQTSGVNYETNTWLYDAGTNTWANPDTDSWSGTGRYLDGLDNDTALGADVLFGGGSNAVGGWAGDTWEYKSSTWSQISVTGPSARIVGGMVYDPQIGMTLLYGGTHNTPVYGDTWEFTGTAWNNITSSLPVSPSARYGTSMVYDPKGPYVLLYGGANFNYVATAETWTFGPAAPPPLVKGWTNITSVAGGPSARTGAAMAYDAHDGYMVLFGGCGQDAAGLVYGDCTSLLGDTWVYEGGLWKEIFPTTAPSARWGSTMTYDATLGELVLFGGDAATGILGDTWAFSGGSWTQLSPSGSPGARWISDLVYDPALSEDLLIGGQSTSVNYETDTWAFSGGTWSSICSTCWGSEGYYLTSADYDPNLGTVVLFGGGCPVGGFCDTTYTFSGNGWSTASFGTAPAVRAGAGMTYDAYNGYTLLFGGTKNGPVYSDTWSIAAASWTNLTATLATSPPPRFLGAMAYDPAEHYVLLFGGTGVGGWLLADSWTYGANYTLWNLNASAPIVAPAALDLGQSTAVSVAATGGAPPYSYSWTGLPSGCASIAASFTCTPTATGNYTVRATVTDLTGSSITSPATLLVVDRDPVGWITPTTPTPTGTVPFPVAFNSGVFGGTPAFTESWNFGDGTYGSGPAPTHVYRLAGTFAVDFWANDSTGYSLRLTTSVVAWLGMTASVSPSSTNVSVGGSLWLNVSVSGGTGGLTYAWTSLVAGCPLGSASADLFCTPTAAGMFLVVVAVTDSQGQVAQATTHVGVYAPISVTLTSGPHAIPFGGWVYFNGSATGGVGALAYSWPVLLPGCTPGSSAAQELCQPTAAGNYSVVLVATDVLGHTSAASASVDVLAVGLLTATLHVSATNISLGLPVYVNTSASGGVGPYAYSWVLLPAGCPAASNAADLVCTLTQAGSAVMEVQVTDARGTKALASIHVNAFEPLTVSLALSEGIVSSGSTVFFNATVSGGYGTIVPVWDGLPSGCSSNGLWSEVCVVSDAGTYLVTVQATNGLGLSATSSPEKLVVNPPPTTTSGGGNSLFSGDALYLLFLVIVLALVVVVLAALLMSSRRQKGAQEMPLPPPLPYYPPDYSQISPTPTSNAPHEDPVPAAPEVRSVSVGPPPARRSETPAKAAAPADGPGSSSPPAGSSNPPSPP